MARLIDRKGKLLRVKFWGCNGSIASPCDSEQIESKIKHVLQLAKPDDIANAVGFLCSDQSSYINGETLHVNGGMYMA